MAEFIDDDPDAFLGEDLKWPLEETSDGDLATVRGLACLEQGLWTPIFTRPGEVTLAPDVGVDFDDVSNAPGFDGERAVLRARLLEQYAADNRFDAVAVDVAIDGSDTVAVIRAKSKTGGDAGVDVPLG